MEVFFVYLWMQVDLWISAATIAGTVVTLFGGVFYSAGAMLNDANSQIVKKFMRALLLFVALPCLLFATIVPNSKTIAVMVGTHFAVAAIDSPEGKKVTSLLRKKANELLDKELVK